MPRFAHRNRLLTGIAVGCIAAALTLHINSVVNLSSSQLVDAMQFLGRILSIPGILLAMTASGSSHTLPLAFAAGGNVAFWLAVCWLLGVVIDRLPHRRGKFATWQRRVSAPEAPSILDAGAITILHDECTRQWHIGSGNGTVRTDNEWLSAVEEQHRANFDLWHIEDEARAPGASDAEIAGVKRRVDETNQLRNDRTEELDRILLAWLEPRGLPSLTAPLHSESPGLIVDRLSILALKIYHTRQEAGREDAPAGHAERNAERLAILESQRNDLAGCLDAFWKQTMAGTRRFKLYRQMKMYNDPSLNPAIYGSSPGSKTG
jgi:hypothetical protein